MSTGQRDLHTDPTLRIMAEASRFARQEVEEVQNPVEDEISDRVYSLLLKNVSRDAPLTPGEIEELKDFRAGLTAEQWQHWLRFARNEKKRLKHGSPRAHDNSSLLSPYDAYHSLNTPKTDSSERPNIASFSDDEHLPLPSTLAPKFVNAQPIKVSAANPVAVQPPSHPKRASMAVDQEPAAAPMVPRSRSTNFNEIPVHEVHPPAPVEEEEQPNDAVEQEDQQEAEPVSEPEDEGLPNRYAMMQSRKSIFHLTRPIGVESEFDKDDEYVPPGASRNPNRAAQPPPTTASMQPDVSMPPPPPTYHEEHTPMRREERLGRPMSSSVYDMPSTPQVPFEPPSELRKTSPIRDVLGNLTQPKLSAYNHHSYNIVPTPMVQSSFQDAESDGVSLDKRKLSSRRSQSAPRARPTPASQAPSSNSSNNNSNNNNPHQFTSSIMSKSMTRSRSPPAAIPQPTAHSMYRSISPVKQAATPMHDLTNSGSWASPMVARKSPPRARVPFSDNDGSRQGNHNMLYSMGRSMPLGRSESPLVDRKSPPRSTLPLDQPTSSLPKNKPYNPEQDFHAYRSIRSQPSSAISHSEPQQASVPNFANFVPQSKPAEPTAIPTIYESAKDGGKRVDAVYSAAKFLLESFDSLISDNKSQSPKDLEAPKMILSQMVQSLEKSRNQLDQIESNASKLLDSQEGPLSVPARSRKMSEDSIIPTHRTESFDQEYFYQRQGDGGTVCSNYSNAVDDIMSEAEPHHDLSVSDLHQRVFQRQTGSVTSEQPSIASHLVEEDIDYRDDVYEEDYHNAQNPPAYLSSSRKFVPSVSHLDTLNYTDHIQTIGSNRPPSGSMISSKTPSRHSYYGNESVITRLCVAQGQLVKTFEEFPIRIDLESSAVDVVWRESRTAVYNTPTHTFTTTTNSINDPPLKSSRGKSPHKNQSVISTRVLRRERFLFNALYYGNTAALKLSGYIRQRTRQALDTGTNMVYLCTSCGDVGNFQEAGQLEAPVMLTLGAGGGSGVASSVLNEIFTYLSQYNAQVVSKPSYMSSNSPYAGVKPTKVCKVTMSAVVVSGQYIVDLLNTNTSSTKPPVIKRFGSAASSSFVALSGATLIELSSAMDYERIIGLLLGRRAGISHSLFTLRKLVTKQAQQSQSLHNSLRSSREFNGNLSTPLDSHASWTSKSSMVSDNAMLYGDDHTDSSDNEMASTLLLTFTASLGSAISKRNTNVTFRVLCPSGDHWHNPGLDLHMLQETICSLPHPPPPNVLSVSPLTMLLTDASAQPSEYVSVISVNRQPDSSINTAHHNDIAQQSLSSLRLASIPK